MSLEPEILVGIFLFLLAHTGALIWLLASIKSELKHMSLTLVEIKGRLGMHGNELDKLTRRMDMTEQILKDNDMIK